MASRLKTILQIISFYSKGKWTTDYSYWTRTGPNTHLTVHIALDDQTLENGALHFVPGSHEWPLLPITSRHFNDMESIKTVLTPEQVAKYEFSFTFSVSK